MIAVGVILARGGSRRLPRKNVLDLCGKPLIAYTIAAAREAKRLGRTIVSTDDEEIASVAAACGAEVPFLRPAQFAADDSSSVDALAHAVDWLEAEGEAIDAVVLLQPTSPMRRGAHIDDCLALLEKVEAETVVSVKRSPAHPYWCWRATESSLVEPFFTRTEIGISKSELPPAFVENGAIYAIRSHLALRRSLYGDRIAAYEMTERDSIDIDTSDDFLRAERALTEANAG